MPEGQVKQFGVVDKDETLPKGKVKIVGYGGTYQTKVIRPAPAETVPVDDDETDEAAPVKPPKTEHVPPR
jgi:hypothetical protein